MKIAMAHRFSVKLTDLSAGDEQAKGSQYGCLGEQIFRMIWITYLTNE
jgi:hypothetical protein